MELTKILIVKHIYNNIQHQYFQKQTRTSQAVMMLSYTTTPKHNDTQDYQYCHKLQNNIYKIVKNIFTTQSERETLIPLMFDSEVSAHTILLLFLSTLCISFTFIIMQLNHW
ncbi:Hypothetical_protein [Hexamita inflata]|uniref:Hypothetical_protein n=1 Tax=Hexamita inflata TaxID=28002 RepID=A0ABP1GEU7_9EUKA